MNIYRVVLQNRRYIKGYLYELFLQKINNNNNSILLALFPPRILQTKARF